MGQTPRLLRTALEHRLTRTPALMLTLAPTLALALKLALTRSLALPLTLEPTLFLGLPSPSPKLRSMLEREDLTGVTTRFDFQQVLAEHCEAGVAFALLLVDLDGFTDVFRRYGQNVGDLLLYEVSSRLAEKLQPRDVVTRSGRSEFAVIAHGATDLRDAGTLASQMIERLQSQITVVGTTFRLSASIGIALFPKNARSWKELLERADAAAYDARQLGKGRVSTGPPGP